MNNAGFPHNIVFDEDAVPSGANAEKLSHEDYLNAPGEKHTATFDVAGTYEYQCEPHSVSRLIDFSGWLQFMERGGSCRCRIPTQTHDLTCPRLSFFLFLQGAGMQGKIIVQ